MVVVVVVVVAAPSSSLSLAASLSSLSESLLLLDALAAASTIFGRAKAARRAAVITGLAGRALVAPGARADLRLLLLPAVTPATRAPMLPEPGVGVG